ncbi:hypothetical protein [Mycobacteroides chelonae]|uniref:Uncharacterized protein n=1 Tax=Mycobacteroides chelonae TaxID=1774 RepID=A0A1S1LXJ9_MYCCH|nr:hypothetical protein [Mycobacteroides chelonae]OHU75640.1 hypothetical protein BKG84_28220 [Mycobacteroides chelonae]
MIPADYQNAWDIVESWQDKDLRQALCQSASEAGRLPHITIAMTRIAALLARISEVERDLVEQLIYVGSSDLMPAILNFTDQILMVLDGDDCPDYRGIRAMLEDVPEQFAFLDIVACDDNADA